MLAHCRCTTANRIARSPPCPTCSHTCAHTHAHFPRARKRPRPQEHDIHGAQRRMEPQQHIMKILPRAHNETEENAYANNTSGIPFARCVEKCACLHASKQRAFDFCIVTKAPNTPNATKRSRRRGFGCFVSLISWLFVVVIYRISMGCGVIDGLQRAMA